MQVNLPPPPLINITFSGQPALSTGVVNLRALLGSTDYVLVKVGPTQGRGKRARGGVSEEVPEDGYTDDDDDDDDEISSNNSGNAAGNSSLRRQVQLCSHAGQPLGCFLVEAGGSYEVVRHVDIFWGLPCGPPPGRRVVAGKKAARERDGEKEKGKEEGEKEDEGEEDARNKRKRQSKRQKEEEKAEKSQKEKRKSEKSKRQEERKAAIVAAVEAAEVNNIHNNNNEEDAEVETRAVHQSDDAEKTAETERDNGKFPAQIQAVHLETPLTQSPGAEEEQREKEEESSSPAPVRTKTVSPPLVASKLPVVETRRRRRPLDNLSSNSSREPANRHHPAESDSNDNEEAEEERRITKRQGKSKGGRKKKCHDSGAMEAVFGGTNNSATPVYSNSLTANVHNEQEQPARVASTPAPNGSAAVDPISSRNSNGMKSKEALRNGLDAETNSAAERRTEEEEEEADDRASSNMVNNGWAPLESPALGFTSVDNTLSQDFSLDSSSIASSADYVY